jgi:hypothetical protein
MMSWWISNDSIQKRKGAAYDSDVVDSDLGELLDLGLESGEVAAGRVVCGQVPGYNNHEI